MTLVVLLVVVGGMLGTATKLATARNIKLQGAVSGIGVFDGSANININTELTNQTSQLNLSSAGKVTFKRKGNIVFVIAESTCLPNKAYTIGGNIATIPDWALPSENILTNSSLKTNTITDMNGYCRGYMSLNKSTKKISVVMNNTDTNNSVSLTMSAVYIVE